MIEKPSIIFFTSYRHRIFRYSYCYSLATPSHAIYRKWCCFICSIRILQINISTVNRHIQFQVFLSINKQATHQQTSFLIFWIPIQINRYRLTWINFSRDSTTSCKIKPCRNNILRGIISSSIIHYSFFIVTVCTSNNQHRPHENVHQTFNLHFNLIFKFIVCFSFLWKLYLIAPISELYMLTYQKYI